MIELRCKKCNKKLCLFDGSVEIVCPRCGCYNSTSSGYNSHKLVAVESKT